MIAQASPAQKRERLVEWYRASDLLHFERVARRPILQEEITANLQPPSRLAGVPPAFRVVRGELPLPGGAAIGRDDSRHGSRGVRPHGSGTLGAARSCGDDGLCATVVAGGTDAAAGDRFGAPPEEPRPRLQPDPAMCGGRREGHFVATIAAVSIAPDYSLLPCPIITSPGDRTWSEERESVRVTCHSILSLPKDLKSSHSSRCTSRFSLNPDARADSKTRPYFSGRTV